MYVPCFNFCPYLAAVLCRRVYTDSDMLRTCSGRASVPVGVNIGPRLCLRFTSPIYAYAPRHYPYQLRTLPHPISLPKPTLPVPRTFALRDTCFTTLPNFFLPGRIVSSNFFTRHEMQYTFSPLLNNRVCVIQCVVDFIHIPCRCTIRRMVQCEIPLSFLNTNKGIFWKKSVAALEQVIVQIRGTIALLCFQFNKINCDYLCLRFIFDLSFNQVMPFLF